MTAGGEQIRIDAAVRPLVVFALDDQRYALPLDRVQRAIRVVAITALPEAPAVVLGVVDLAGVVTPVIDLRQRFHHPPREVRSSDHLVLAHTGRRLVALLVDETRGVITPAAETLAPTGGILPGLALVDGAVKLEDGLVLIHDLERLLSLDEDAAISRAISAADGTLP